MVRRVPRKSNSGKISVPSSEFPVSLELNIIEDESKPSESCFASETALSTLSRYLVATELDVNIRNNALKAAVVRSRDPKSGEREKEYQSRTGLGRRAPLQ